MSLPVVLIADKLAQSTVDALGDGVEVRWVDGPDREKLLAAVPGVMRWRAPEVLAALNETLTDTGMSSLRGVAAYLAQLGHESGSFRYLQELADGSAYEPHTRVGRRLGNVQEGDGPRFKGRGWIQLTGRANYRSAGQALGLPLEDQPDLAADVATAARVAAWYWRTRGCAPLADAGDFVALTRKINGGTNGLDDRQARYARALNALGVV